ncbi:MAG: vitamin K epoxide reductase family protein [Gemmatimonadota bacterium]
MGTRGGRPEPQQVVPGGKNQQRGRQGGSRPGNGRPQPMAARTAPSAAKPAAKPAAGPAAGPPPWLRWATLALALIGLGVSIYLTYAHYTEATTLACPDTGTVNCVKVTTSPQSEVFGVFPVADLGLAFYLFMVAATTPWAWRARWPVVHWARLVSVIVGILFVLYLIFAELFLVKAICLWCTGVHVVTFLLFVLVVTSAAIWGVSRTGAAPE